MLRASTINRALCKTVLVSGKIPARTLGKKGSCRSRDRLYSWLGDVYRGVMNKRASLEVCW